MQIDNIVSLYDTELLHVPLFAMLDLLHFYNKLLSAAPVKTQMTLY